MPTAPGCSPPAACGQTAATKRGRPLDPAPPRGPLLEEDEGSGAGLELEAADVDDLAVEARGAEEVDGRGAHRETGGRGDAVVRDEGVPPVAGDLVFVDAELVDEAGDIVPEARPVAFSATECEIVGAMESTEAGIASCLVRAGNGGAVRVVANLRE